MAIAAKDIMLKGTNLHVNDRGAALVKKLSSRYRAWPVVNDDCHVVGIIVEESILGALRDTKALFRCTAGQLMICGHRGHDHACENPVMVSPDTPMDQVLQTMRREHLSVVPVVRDRVLVGVINRGDLKR